VVLERGGSIVNVSAIDAEFGWELQRQTSGASGVALIHAGNAPGVTSLVAADLLHSHPDADELEVAFSISAGGTSGRAGAGLIHRYLTAARHHPTFRAELPPPLGNRAVFEVGPEERGWLSENLVSGRTVRLGIYFRERSLQALFRTLNGLRMMAGVPRFTFTVGRGRPPDEPTTEPIMYWVAAKRGGHRLAACTIAGRGDYRMTSESAVAFAEALVERRAAEPALGGVFAPEELFTFDQLRPALERRGFGFAAR
jgi:hypothetical protein